MKLSNENRKGGCDMRKRIFVIMIIVVCFVLSACSNLKHVEEMEKWDCSVMCAEKSDEDSYVVTYSDAKIVSNTGTLSFQNQNDFDIVIHLMTDDQEERISEIAAGGVTVLYEVEKDAVYTVGCHADIVEGTEIKLMVYDGEESEIFSME